MSENHIETSAAVRPQDLADRFERELAEVTDQLNELERLAAAKGKRRGDRRKGGNDTQKYRLGSVFWVLMDDIDKLDDLALLGLLSSGESTLHLLNKFGREEDTDLLQPILRIMADKNLYRLLRERGGALRWEKNSALYFAEVEKFASSAKAQNPNAAWRKKSPTRNQIYLISEVVRCFDLSPPAICTRGEAFEWLYEHGGNPRFAQPQQIGE